ncbi:phasin family protein [Sneathiella limimaris]|uniref:phasin family protein n=1 Tax=Sneathiella limimaris TaxID=1964213 RepID=UPI00146AD787|nr:phasin family protein [Sneathiella limimaris]
MSTTKAKTSAKATNGSKAEKIENPFVTKDFETAMSAGKKSLQDAFLTSAEMAENAYKSGHEAFKTSFEKAVKDSKAQVEKATKTLADVPMYDKESAEPFLKAGTAVVEKGEKISFELIEFGTGRMDAYFATARSVIEAEDVQKALELQTEFARDSVETFVSEVSKLNAMFVDASKTVMEPFGAQYAASMDKFLSRA